MKHLRLSRLVIALTCLVLSFAGIATPSYAQAGDTITISDTRVMPDSVVYHPGTDTFLISSSANGTIYQVGQDGSLTPFIQDPDLKAAFGMVLDATSNKLYVVNANIGQLIALLRDGGFPGGGQPPANVTPQPGQVPPGFSALNFSISLLVFDVASKQRVLMADLTTASAQAGPRFARDITLDEAGNAYVTDSVTAAIYRVDPQGAVAFLTDPKFQVQADGAGQGGPGGGFGAGLLGGGLSGIVAHPDGYLIVGIGNQGKLLKIPLDNPQNVTHILLPSALQGVRSLALTADGKLIVVMASETPSVALVSSNDQWVNGSIEKRVTLAVGPSSVTLKGAEVWVLESGLSFAGVAQGQPPPAPVAPILKRVSFD